MFENRLTEKTNFSIKGVVLVQNNTEQFFHETGPKQRSMYEIWGKFRQITVRFFSNKMVLVDFDNCRCFMCFLIVFWLEKKPGGNVASDVLVFIKTSKIQKNANRVGGALGRGDRFVSSKRY